MKRKPNGELLPPIPNWVPEEAWRGWLEMRRARKVPNTERALVVALAKLDRLREAGEKVEAVIDQSTERGWTTFYPYKDTIPAKPAAKPAEERKVVERENVDPGVPMPAEIRNKLRSLVRGSKH